jgi:hypothetical protein
MPAKPPVQTRKNLSAKASFERMKELQLVDQKEPIIPDSDEFFQFELPFKFNQKTKELNLDFECNHIIPFAEQFDVIEKVMEFIEYRMKDILPHFTFPGKPIDENILVGHILGLKEKDSIQLDVNMTLEMIPHTFSPATGSVCTKEYRFICLGAWKKDKNRWIFKKPYQ